MKHKQLLLMVIVMVLVSLGLIGCQANTELTCEGGTFTQFRLTNTMERSYEDAELGYACTIDAEDEGVIWIAIGEGHDYTGDKLIFTNDQGIQLKRLCWATSTKSEDSAQTEMLLYGPADSKNISVCCGDVCADALIK